MRGHLGRGRAGVEEGDLPIPEQLHRSPGDGGLGGGGLVPALGVDRGCGRLGDGPTVDPPEQPFFRQLAQVASDRVFRNSKMRGQLRRENALVATQRLEDPAPPFRVQHWSVFLHDSA